MMEEIEMVMDVTLTANEKMISSAQSALLETQSVEEDVGMVS